MYFEFFPIHIIDALIAFLLGFVLYLVTESLKKPNLQIQITSPSDLNLPQGEFRILNLKVSNTRKRRIIKYFDQTATQLKATLYFCDYDSGVQILDPIVGRWNTTKEPLSPDGKFVDNGLALVPQREVLPPGEETSLSIAIKKLDNDNCFPFNNESYLYLPDFANPKWKIEDEKFIVYVKLQSAEAEKESKKFIVINKGGLDRFKISQSA